MENAPAIKRTIQLLASGETLDRIVILEIYITELKNVLDDWFWTWKASAFPPYYYPHNFLVEFITEFGIIGALFWFL